MRRDRFPWPLAAGPAIVVVASFVTLALAVTYGDSLVASNYYRLGLTINRELAAEPVRAVEGEATVTIGASGEVRVTLDRMAPSSLALSVRAPGERNAIGTIALHRVAANEWTGMLARATPGRHIVVLVAGGWRLPVTLVERLPATVRLRAESRSS
jgi:hypothetical protein